MNEDPCQSKNEGKANLDHIYNRPDPRAYFSTLEPLSYIIPGQAKTVFKTIMEAITEQKKNNKVKIIDVGCSYGVNGALLKYDFIMPDLYEHYCASDSNGISQFERLSRDRKWIESCDGNDDFTVIGLDVSERAVQYGLEVGFLDDGIVANLEEGELTPQIEEEIEGADLVISTGCVGYVTEKTFSQLLNLFDEDSLPWFASFVLRMFPYDSISQVFDRKGLLTEKLEEPTFIQRRFRDEEEKEYVIHQLETHGIDPSGKETEGNYIANFFLSRPESEIQRLPLQEILKDQGFSNLHASILDSECIS